MIINKRIKIELLKLLTIRESDSLTQNNLSKTKKLKSRENITTPRTFCKHDKQLLESFLVYTLTKHICSDII